MSRIVFITQSYRPEDTIVGVARDWVHALASRSDGVDVIALTAQQPPAASGRVRVYSLGKDTGAGRAAQARAFYVALAKTLPGAAAVFVHMVPRYAVLAAPLALALRRPMALWYAQGGTSRALHAATRLVTWILTPTRDSFPFSGPAVDRRLRITGHGVDTRRYAPTDSGAESPETGRLLAAGRLSPAKRYEALLDALALTRTPRWQLRLATGSSYATNHAYETSIRQRVESLHLSDRVSFLGHVDYEAMPREYRAAWLLAHTSGTGSLDKVVLEAAACGTPVVSTAPSSEPVLRSVDQRLCPPGNDPQALAQALDTMLGWSHEQRGEVGAALRAEVVRSHSLDRWADGVAAILSRRA